MQKLGVNTIRVYNLSPAINHDECVSIFNSVGIYMLIDVNSPLPNDSINSGDPGSSYSSTYLQRIFEVVEAFKDYPNLLGFFGGNEVVNNIETGKNVPPYLRAVTRDLKNYIAKHATRAIPVGYSAADVREILVDSWEYLQCTVDGTKDDKSRIDFFGLNSYSWCGSTATFQTAGYDILVSDFSNTTVPVFFSEYGCNKVTPRVWTEVQALYSDQMTSVMSGGLAYEYTQDPSNNFGLVVVNSNGTATLRTDFDNFQMQLNKLDVKTLESANMTATSLTPPKCKSSLIGSSGFNNEFTIPSIPPGGQDLINNGIKNPKKGKLVQVAQLNVPMTVYGSNGAEIKGLAIKPLPNDESNTPGGENTSGSTPTTSTSATPSPTGAAVAKRVQNVLGLVVTAALITWSLEMF